jgi:hypothetical protein
MRREIGAADADLNEFKVDLDEIKVFKTRSRKTIG